MVEKKFEERLSIWHRFRKFLETSEDPIQDTLSFWMDIPSSTRNCDPYDPLTWPDPWQMIDENCYCDFTKILAIGYTLQLTDKFKNERFLIKVGVDKIQSRMYYILCIGDNTISINDVKSMQINLVPKDIHIQKIHDISGCQ